MFQLTRRSIAASVPLVARQMSKPAKTTAPGRGGRPGACMSEAFGGNRARRGDGTVLKRVWELSPLPSDADGVQLNKNKLAFLHIGNRENAYGRPELTRVLSSRARR